MPERIVIDLGAATYGADESIHALIERYDPDRLYAFDPWPDFAETRYMLGRTEVISRRAAAWTSAGTAVMGGAAGGLHATMMLAKNQRNEWKRKGLIEVEAFDLTEFLSRFAPDAWICLKLDVEGAEVELLEHLIETGAISAVDELLVEWHDHLIPELAERKAAILHELPWIEPWG